MTHLEKVTDLNNLVGSGKLMDAFEKYYHSDVVMQEVGEAARVGKEINREYEIKFLEMIKEFHGFGVTTIAADEANNKTVVESWMDVTLKNDTRVKMEQVAVQTWDGDHITNETFYHK